jgi:hypothetical protein
MDGTSDHHVEGDKPILKSQIFQGEFGNLERERKS